MEELNLTVMAIAAANRLYNYPTEQPVIRRSRARWAVALKRTGKTYYTVNGREYLSDAHHPVILPKGCTYSWRCVEEGECLMIEFDAPQTHSTILSFSLSDSAVFENTFLDIQKNLHTGTASAHLTCLHRLYGLLLHLFRSAEKEYIPKAKQKLLAPAVDYMAAHYFNPTITNDRLAELCGISTVHFRKSFEALYGVSPIRWLHDLRIQQAKDILASDFGSISQVAESVGYASVYHFSKMFKHYTGLSPTEYAKRAPR